MPKPTRKSRRTWVAAWAVLCAAGLAATAGLRDSSVPDSLPEKPVSAECGECIADIETQRARAEQDGEGDGLLAFSARGGTWDDCRDALRDYFGGER